MQQRLKMNVDSEPNLEYALSRLVEPLRLFHPTQLSLTAMPSKQNKKSTPCNKNPIA